MPGWAAGPCVYHGDGALWHVAAIDLRPRGRQAKREAITATGMTEIAALEALTALLVARQMSEQYGGAATLARTSSSAPGAPPSLDGMRTGRPGVIMSLTPRTPVGSSSTAHLHQRAGGGPS
jgi:hypothetical protein